MEELAVSVTNLHGVWLERGVIAQKRVEPVFHGCWMNTS
jgi:hypothetical protein